MRGSFTWVRVRVVTEAVWQVPVFLSQPVLSDHMKLDVVVVVKVREMVTSSIYVPPFGKFR